jgi:hypothetical protein
LNPRRPALRKNPPLKTRAGEWLASGPAALFPNGLVGSKAAVVRLTPSIARPSHQACAMSQVMCVRQPLPSQVMCVGNGHLLRVGPFIIARRYTYPDLAGMYRQTMTRLYRSPLSVSLPAELRDPARPRDSNPLIVRTGHRPEFTASLAAARLANGLVKALRPSVVIAAAPAIHGWTSATIDAPSK